MPGSTKSFLEEAVVRNAERVMAVIEARDLWVSDAAARAEAALRAEATGEANGTVVTKVQKEKAA